MTIQFVKLSPTQNMTILVKNFFDNAKFVDVANKLLDYTNVHAEQVGFITNPISKNAMTRLDMMGGEFCGNATMSLASFYAREHNFPKDIEQTVKLEVSGADGIVNCHITPKDDYYIGKVKIPAPTSISDIEISTTDVKLQCKLVHIEGISHIFIESDNIDKELISNYIIKNYKNYTTQDALGVLFYNAVTKFMYPIVYVISTNSIIHERGCGSGSAAACAVLTMQQKTTSTIEINQPGGHIKTTAVYKNEQLTEIWIEGKVFIVAEGNAYIS